MTMKRIKNTVIQNRMAIFFFIYSLIYSLIFVNRLTLWKIDDYAIYSFYAVDFSYGFATKLLPGALFNALFGSHATRTTATLFVSVIMLLFFFGLALLLQKFLLHIPKESRKSVFILILFYLSGSYTFSIFTKTIGLFDTYWIFAVLLFFCIIDHKRLRLLIPLLFAGCVLVHNASVISYVILMAIVLLLKASLTKEEPERRSLLAVFTISMAITVVLAVFFGLYETKMICDIETFHEKLLQHGSDCFYYYDYAFFDIYNGEPYIPDFVFSTESIVLRFFYTVLYRIKLNYRVLLSRGPVHLLSVCCGILVLSPILYCFTRFHLSGFHKEKNSLRRLCSILMILQSPFTLCTALLFSEDVTRWFSNAFLISFTLIFSVMYYDSEQRELFLKRLNPILNSTITKIYFLTYASISLLTVY